MSEDKKLLEKKLMVVEDIVMGAFIDLGLLLEDATDPEVRACAECAADGVWVEVERIMNRYTEVKLRVIK